MGIPGKTIQHAIKKQRDLGREDFKEEDETLIDVHLEGLETSGGRNRSVGCHQ